MEYKDIIDRIETISRKIDDGVSRECVQVEIDRLRLDIEIHCRKTGVVLVHV